MLKNANQIAVSHPSDRCDDSSLLKISPPSVHVNLIVPTITERWVERKSLHYLFTNTSALSLQRHPSGLLWVGTLPRWNNLTAPVTSETTLEEFPYMYTNASNCWLRTPASCRANWARPLSTSRGFAQNRQMLKRNCSLSLATCPGAFAPLEDKDNVTCSA